jgi:hypothetical protein
MRRVLVAVSLAVPLWAPDPLVAQDGAPFEVAGVVSLASDYRFRGISQTLSEMAVQGGIEVSVPSGWYGGVWGSNLNFGEPSPDGRAQAEVDVFAGFSRGVGSGYEVDVGLIYYAYPGSSSDYSYNFVELGLGLLPAARDVRAEQHQAGPDHVEVGLGEEGERVGRSRVQAPERDVRVRGLVREATESGELLAVELRVFREGHETALELDPGRAEAGAGGGQGLVAPGDRLHPEGRGQRDAGVERIVDVPGVVEGVDVRARDALGEEPLAEDAGVGGHPDCDEEELEALEAQESNEDEFLTCVTVIFRNMLKNNPETVCRLIQLAKTAQGREAAVIPDDTNSPAEDWGRQK